jgi:hypothetical protein
MTDQPQEPEPHHGVPVFVFVAALLVVAIVTGSVVWAVRVRTAGPAPVSQPVLLPPTSTVSVAPTSPASAVPTASAAPTAATPTPPPLPTPASGVFPAIITHMSWSAKSGYRIVADYVQVLTGEAAADAATAHGDESPPPNDYYILNESAKLRTLALAKTPSITVLGWEGADSTAKQLLSAGQFFDVMPGGANTQEPWSTAYYHLTVKSGTITRIEQIYFP